MNRRGFLGAMLAAGAAPAIVRAESLMVVRNRIIVPPYLTTEQLVEEGWEMWDGGARMAENLRRSLALTQTEVFRRVYERVFADADIWVPR